MSKIDNYMKMKVAVPKLNESIDHALKTKPACGYAIKESGSMALFNIQIKSQGYSLIDESLAKYLALSIEVCMPHLLEKAREIAQRELDGQRIAALAEAKDIQNEIEMKD